MGLKLFVDEGTRETSTVRTMSTNCVNAHPTQTGSPWPWHGYRGGRFGLHGFHMPWQPSANV